MRAALLVVPDGAPAGTEVGLPAPLGVGPHHTDRPPRDLAIGRGGGFARTALGGDAPARNGRPVVTVAREGAAVGIARPLGVAVTALLWRPHAGAERAAAGRPLVETVA